MLGEGVSVGVGVTGELDVVGLAVGRGVGSLARDARSSSVEREEMKYMSAPIDAMASTIDAIARGRSRGLRPTGCAVSRAL
jgi:hypothetical protein